MVPLFAGFLVVTAQIAPINLNNYLTRYILTILSFAIWSFGCNVIPSLLPKITDTSFRAAGRVIVALGLIIAFGVSLVILSHHTEDLLFQYELFIFLLLSISYRFYHQKVEAGTIRIQTFYTVGLSLLSFQMSISSFSWQLLIFCLGFSLIFIELRRAIFFQKPNSVILTSGICCIWALVFSQDLPSLYLIVAGSLLYQGRQKATITPLIFLAILITLSFY